MAATKEYVVVSSRDFTDKLDFFRCFDAKTGEPKWTVLYPAMGALDYGNSPRATPLIRKGLVFTLGAFGHLQCLDLKTGAVRWRKDILFEYGVERKLVRGTTASPLIVDDKLIVNPGGPESSLIALDPQTSELVWKSPGGPFAFASFDLLEFGQNKVIH